MGVEDSARGGGTVGKALDVLDAVAAEGRPVRFSELLERSDFPKATLYRLLQVLTSQGMLSFDPERGVYELGVRLVRLAHAAWSNASLAPVARPHLDALAEELGEVVHLAQLDHGQVLYVDKRNPCPGTEMFSQTGRVGPAYCTGVGKAMLAFLPEAQREEALDMQSLHRFTPATITDRTALRAELETVRTEGVAYDREEHEAGIVCVAMPILTRGGRLLGALSVTTSLDRCDLGALRARLPRISRTARAIEADIHAWRFPDGDAVASRAPQPRIRHDQEQP